MEYNWCSLIYALAFSGGLISTVPKKSLGRFLFWWTFLDKVTLQQFYKKVLIFYCVLCWFYHYSLYFSANSNDIFYIFITVFDSIGLIFNFVVKMGKLPQISKASKSNVIFLKQEGYKNVEISKRLKLSEASVSRMLQRNKQNLSLSPLKRSGTPRTTTPRTDCKIKQLCQKQPFISSSEIKRSMQELIVWRQEQLEIVCTKILNFLPANLWRNPWLHQEWPSKGLNFAATTKTGQKKIGRKWCLLTNPPSYSLLPTNPSFADHMDLHQRTYGTSNQPFKHPHRSWCGGAFPAKAEVVFIFSQKDKQWMPHGILAS